MTEFAVSEKKNRLLREKMDALDIREEDMEEKFIRASGRGGQKINKSSVAVYIKHKPTGIEVKCMKERSQSVNRFLARRELADRVESMQGGKTKQDIAMERIRKQKAKKKKRAKVKYSATGGLPEGQNDRE